MYICLICVSLADDTAAVATTRVHASMHQIWAWWALSYQSRMRHVCVRGREGYIYIYIYIYIYSLKGRSGTIDRQVCRQTKKGEGRAAAAIATQLGFRDR